VARDNWRTPRWVFHLAEGMFGDYVLDVAADQENAMCVPHYSVDDDGLQQRWTDGSWCNPPYSNITPWVECAIEQEVRATLLIPAPNGESRDLLTLSHASDLVFFQERVAFVDPDSGKARGGNPRGSVLAHFDPNMKRSSPQVWIVSKEIATCYKRSSDFRDFWFKGIFIESW
jgi:phage N-6-adenine-methyltransferase